jgi:hypothetical protein
MNKNNVAIAMIEGAIAVNVTFEPSGGKYTYLSLQKLEVGDRVVVDTPRAGLTVVKVTAVDVGWDIDANFNYKFIVSKVDMAQYEQLTQAIEEVKDIIEAQRREAARKSMMEHLGLKASAVKSIEKVVKGLPRL